MKKVFYYIVIFTVVSACANSKSIEEPAKETNTESEIGMAKPEIATENPQEELTEIPQDDAETIKPIAIEWLDFETAIERNQKAPKLIFIDVYTEWCGWCKKMDASTFVNPEVAAFMTKHFYAVKMDAEMKEAIAYNGQLFEYKQYSPKAGYNTLAVSLLDSKMSFPSFVILDKKEVKKGKIMGYKAAAPFLIELKKYVKQ